MTATTTKRVKKNDAKNDASNNLTKFTSKLHGKMGTTKENSFYSSYSIQCAFGMLLAGAKNATLESMEKFFHQDVNSCKSLVNEIVQNNQKEFELKTANALWSNQNFKVKEEFQQTIKDGFNGTAEELDFTKPDEVCKTINDWCDTNTNGKIPEVITVDSIKANTEMVLTNAIYFKGKWENEFDKKFTKPQDFLTPDGVKKVDTMYGCREGLYCETDDYKAINLPYKGKELSMVVVLPKENTTEKIEKDLEKTYNEVNSGWQHEKEIRVYLPKFELKTDYDMSDSLKELGLTLPFSDDADFTGVSNIRTKVDQVIHKAYVKCDEEGTEAAAVTAIVAVRCAAFAPKRIVEFKADHSFLFFIRNDKTGTILFVGRVTNP